MPSLYQLIILALVTGGIVYETRKMKQDKLQGPSDATTSSHSENQAQIRIKQIDNLPSQQIDLRTREAPATVRDIVFNTHDIRGTPGSIPRPINEKKHDGILIIPQPINMRTIMRHNNW
jgi:hypothetical protein